MKKIISAILATLMLFTLAACGEESTPAEATAQTTKATTAEKEIQTTTTADPNAPKEIDVFEFVEVIYSGISPDGTAEINYDEIPDELADNAEFTIDKTEGLKNGDTITLTCIPEESLLVFENIVPTRLTKEVTVDGVAEYITDISKYDLTSINKTNDELVNIQLSYIIKIGEKTLKHNIVEDLGSAEMWTVEDMKINLSEQYFFAKKDEHQGVKVTADNLMRDYNNVENSLISVYKGISKNWLSQALPAPLSPHSCGTEYLYIVIFRA
jgi:predicted small lipoprotein YifL